MKFILTMILGLLAAGPAQAQLSGCQLTTGPMVLQKVRSTASGTQIFGCLNASFDTLSSSATPTGSSTTAASMGELAVRKITGLSIGTANIQISSAVTVTSSVTVTGGGGLEATYGVKSATASFGSGATVSTFSITGALNLASGAAVMASGAGGNFVGVASGTFNAVFANGSGLTSLTAANISAGSLGPGVIASSIAANVIIGPNIAASTITLNKLNQSGCTTNDIPKWNGITWACATDSTGGGGSGTLIQSTMTLSCTAGSFSTQIPYDDTIPQYSATEGTQIYSSTFTLLTPTNRVRITVNLPTGCDAQAPIIVALFADGAADALAANAAECQRGDSIYNLPLVHEMAGYSGGKNFTLRYGPGTAIQVHLNRAGASPSNIFSTAGPCNSVKIEEVTP